VTSPLISPAELGPPAPAGGQSLLDVRWTLAGGPDRAGYERGHLPGAVFIDLDRDLAAAAGPAGRHPLPDPGVFAAAMRRAGVGAQRAVVVYDDAGSMAAARAWWLLRYHGHPDVRVLDGGLAAWTAAGGELRSGSEEPVAPGDFVARPGAMDLLDAGAAAALARDGVLLDARAPERFRGESEPVDPVAGHIPGARNLPAAMNVAESGAFRAPDEIRSRLTALGVTDATSLGAYCGSGITAAHLVLALELAGVRAALYAGSWSEWIADPARPVATGA
jgi:thiosulfate/3-mercaptopyruvate sulfurtransferase